MPPGDAPAKAGLLIPPPFAASSTLKVADVNCTEDAGAGVGVGVAAGVGVGLGVGDGVGEAGEPNTYAELLGAAPTTIVSGLTATDPPNRSDAAPSPAESFCC